MNSRDFRRESRPKPGFRVFHGVSELGIGAWISKTRGRLILSAGLVLATFLGYTLLSTSYMRSTSTSVTVNLILITVAMLLMLLAALVIALLVGDLLFPGPWRERVILGQKLDVDEDESLDIAIGKFKDHTMPFYGVAGLLLVLFYLSFGWVSGDFLGEYHDWGYQYTLLRSGEPEAQIRGIRNVLNPRNQVAQQTQQVRTMLIELANEADDEVRPWAIWSLGELRIFESIESLSEMVGDPLLSDTLRARAAESLGRLGSREGALQMAEMLVDSFGRDELSVGLLRGLGMAREEETARYISPMIGVDPREIRGTAFWALGRTGDDSYRDAMVSFLEEGTDDERCFAAEALKFLAAPENLVAAHSWFASVPPIECEPVDWRLPFHWSDEETFRQDVVVAESLEAKCLKIIFSAGGVGQRDFFASIANDESRAYELRALARELALRIDHRR